MLKNTNPELYAKIKEKNAITKYIESFGLTINYSQATNQTHIVNPDPTAEVSNLGLIEDYENICRNFEKSLK